MSNLNDYRVRNGYPTEPYPQYVQNQNQLPQAPSRGDNIAETVLTIVAYIILILGVLASLTVGIYYITHSNSNLFYGMGIIIIGLIVTLIVWAQLMLFVNISVNVRAIKQMLG